MSEVLPDGWCTINLLAIADVKTGKHDANHAKVKGKYRFYTCAYEHLLCDTSAFSGECLILPGNGANVGEVFFYDGEFDAYQRTYVIENIKIVPKLLYFIFYYNWKEKTTAKQYGSATNYIRMGNFEDYNFLIPPLNEQKRIVAKLDKIIPRIDKVKERLDKIPVIIKRFRQSVLTAAVTGKLTEEWREENPDVESAEVLLKNNKYVANTDYKEIVDIPSKWCWCALGNYAELSRGRFSIRPRNDPRYYDGKYPFIQIGDLPREGGCINSHRQTLNEKGLKISKEFEQYTIAIAIVGATIGNTGILAYKMCFPDSLIGIKMKTKFESFYTDFYLRTEKENIRNISYSSGGQPNIKLPILTGYPFPLPPLEEQKEIVRQVDNLFALADKLETHYQKAKAKVDKLSQSVLAKAFRGELVPQDPNDEPAEKLLERIMKEKAKMEAELKKTKKKKSRKKAKSKQ
jgi:type I restriction enzyme S subunit